MILDLFVSAVLAAVDALLSLIPEMTLPTGAANGVLDLLLAANRIVPISVFCTGLLLYIGLSVALASFQLAMFVWHQVHGAS